MCQVKDSIFFKCYDGPVVKHKVCQVKRSLKKTGVIGDYVVSRHQDHCGVYHCIHADSYADSRSQ